MKRLVLAAIVAAAVAAAHGQIIDARALGSQVIVNEQKVAMLKTSRGGQTPKKRAESAALTLLAFKSGDALEVEPPILPSKDWGINLGTRRIFTITEEEAKAHVTTQQGLAEKWAQGLQRAIMCPPLSIGKDQMTLPPDKPQTTTLIGPRARKAVLSQSPAGLVSVERRTGEIVIKPLKKGSGTLTIRSGEEVVSLKISVLPYAATFPVRCEASVLGDPALPLNVVSAVRGSLGRIPVSPGSRVTVSEIPEASLRPGETKELRIPLSADGPEAFPAQGEAIVTVRNRGAMPRDESVLWYSNDPENVEGPRRLYWGRLESGQPVRLLAHHKNVSFRDLDVLFSLTNPGDTPIQVGVNLGDSRPDLNPTLAGYIAGDVFMRSWMNRSGEVVPVPANSSVPLIIRRVKPEQTMSALASLSILGNSGHLLLVGEALPPGGLPGGWSTGGGFPFPWTKLPAVSPTEEGFTLDGSPMHIYSPPRKEVSFENDAGRFTFVRIGETAIKSVGNTGNNELLGNFGVHYKVAGTILNTGTLSQNVEVVFEASAGYSGAIFIVNGQYVPARILQAKQVVRLWNKVMEPGEKESVVVQTIPLSGAHYPATIIVRPVDSIQ